MSQGLTPRGLSLRSKLILTLVPLVMAVVGFVNFATLSFFREDKEAYVYELQGVQVQLLARELAQLVQKGTGFLEQVLTIRGLSGENQQSLFSRQTGLKQFAIYPWNPAGPETEPVRALSGTASEAPTADWLSRVKPTLASQGRALFNASSVGSEAQLGIAIVIQGRLGVVWADLSGFGQMAKSQNVTVSTMGGEALFDSDPKVQFENKSVLSDPLFQAALNHPLSAGGKEYNAQGDVQLGSFARHPAGFIALSRTPKSQAMRATYLVMERSVLLSALGVGAALILSVLFAARLTGSLGVLQRATAQVAAGDFDTPVLVESKDEVGALAFAFQAMAQRIRELIVEREDKVRLEGEIAIASTVQQTLFPPEYYSDPSIEIQSHYKSASQCGGDWWGFFRVGSKGVFLIADATGHGIPSALVTASARSCFSVLQKLATDAQDFPLTPSLLLSFANQSVHEAANGKIMMTFFVGIADFDAKTLTYASAGHNPPWLYRARAGGGYKSESLVSKGPRLGESLYVPSYDEKTVELGADDMLVLYTDGLLEDKNEEGTQYGKKRARKVIESHLAEGPKAVTTQLVRDFMSFNGSKPLDDDLTLAVVKFSA